jgi:hypothetical protein
MKITKKRLIQIINEELELLEAPSNEEVMAAIADIPDAAGKIADRVKTEIKRLAEPSGLDPLVLAQAVAALLTAE